MAENKVVVEVENADSRTAASVAERKNDAANDGQRSVTATESKKDEERKNKKASGAPSSSHDAKKTLAFDAASLSSGRAVAIGL